MTNAHHPTTTAAAAAEVTTTTATIVSVEADDIQTIESSTIDSNVELVCVLPVDTPPSPRQRSSRQRSFSSAILPTSRHPSRNDDNNTENCWNGSAVAVGKGQPRVRIPAPLSKAAGYSSSKNKRSSSFKPVTAAAIRPSVNHNNISTDYSSSKNKRSSFFEPVTVTTIHPPVNDKNNLKDYLKQVKLLLHKLNCFEAAMNNNKPMFDVVTGNCESGLRNNNLKASITAGKNDLKDHLEQVKLSLHKRNNNLKASITAGKNDLKDHLEQVKLSLHKMNCCVRATRNNQLMFDDFAGNCVSGLRNNSLKEKITAGKNDLNDHFKQMKFSLQKLNRCVRALNDNKLLELHDDFFGNCVSGQRNNNLKVKITAGKNDLKDHWQQVKLSLHKLNCRATAMSSKELQLDDLFGNCVSGIRNNCRAASNTPGPFASISNHWQKVKPAISTKQLLLDRIKRLNCGATRTSNIELCASVGAKLTRITQLPNCDNSRRRSSEMIRKLQQRIIRKEKKMRLKSAMLLKKQLKKLHACAVNLMQTSQEKDLLCINYMGAVECIEKINHVCDQDDSYCLLSTASSTPQLSTPSCTSITFEAIEGEGMEVQPLPFISSKQPLAIDNDESTGQQTPLDIQIRRLSSHISVLTTQEDEMMPPLYRESSFGGGSYDSNIQRAISRIRQDLTEKQMSYSNNRKGNDSLRQKEALLSMLADIITNLEEAREDKAVYQELQTWLKIAEETLSKTTSYNTNTTTSSTSRGTEMGSRELSDFQEDWVPFDRWLVGRGETLSEYNELSDEETEVFDGLNDDDVDDDWYGVYEEESVFSSVEDIQVSRVIENMSTLFTTKTETKYDRRKLATVESNSSGTRTQSQIAASIEEIKDDNRDNDGGSIIGDEEEQNSDCDAATARLQQHDSNCDWNVLCF